MVADVRWMDENIEFGTFKAILAKQGISEERAYSIFKDICEAVSKFKDYQAQCVVSGLESTQLQTYIAGFLEGGVYQLQNCNSMFIDSIKEPVESIEKNVEIIEKKVNNIFIQSNESKSVDAKIDESVEKEQLPGD